MRHEIQDLWPLREDGPARIAERLARGMLSPAEAEGLRTLAEKGYLVLHGAIPDELVDALNRDVSSISTYPGCFVTTDHRRGRSQRLSGPDFDAFESVFDPYVNFESARQVGLHPTILRWLELAFDTRVIATQQLLFQRSNQHPIHQDTSVVCVEEPRLMLATWIALEDVVPGRGELTYYEGSHRIAPFPFKDGSKRLDPRVDDEATVRAHITRECERLGCTKRDFVAKKGDVLFWAADLVHASNPRTRPEEETRRSVVTHYCPSTTRPYWFRFHKGKRALQSYRGRADYASLYYQLPTPAGAMARPSYELP